MGPSFDVWIVTCSLCGFNKALPKRVPADDFAAQHEKEHERASAPDPFQGSEFMDEM